MREKKLAALKTEYDQMVRDADSITSADQGESPEAQVSLGNFIEILDMFYLKSHISCFKEVFPHVSSLVENPARIL